MSTETAVQPIEVTISLANLIELMRRGRTKTRRTAATGAGVNDGAIYRLTLENRHLLTTLPRKRPSPGAFRSTPTARTRRGSR